MAIDRSAITAGKMPAKIGIVVSTDEHVQDTKPQKLKVNVVEDRTFLEFENDAVRG